MTLSDHNSKAHSLRRHFGSCFAVRGNLLKATVGILAAAIFLSFAATGYAQTTPQQQLETVKKQYNEWRAFVAEYQKVDKEALDQLRQAMCEEDLDKIEDRVNDTADRIAERVKSQALGIAAGAAALQNALQPLKSGATQSDAERLAYNINSVMKSLDRAMNSPANELHGSQNPKIRARIEYGKEQHKQLQQQCTRAEVTITGVNSSSGEGRLDCIDSSGGACVLVEIKPNNPNAIAAGDRQLLKYKNAIEKVYGDNKGLGGFDSASQSVFKNCETPTNGSQTWHLNLVLAPVKTYNFCPRNEDLSDTSPIEMPPSS